MAKLYGKDYTKQELLHRVGSISQIAGVRSVQLQDGNEMGVRAVEFKTGSGLNFTVLADRGLDISTAEFCGQAFAWRSTTGDISPVFYEPEGMRWLRSFYGGLVLTCGLITAGAPSVDQGEELGQHGRYSNIPAKNVWADGEWDGDDYVMWVQGKVQETRMFGENIVLTRKIWTKLGEKRLWIRDVAENQGYETTPHMILYHINGGFPAVDAGSQLLAPTIATALPRDKDAETEKELYGQFASPTPGFKERVYYHDMAADAEGFVRTALVNKAFNGGQGFGFYIKYRKSQLPEFTEWKMNGLGTYVVGMEPANCRVEGRAKERERGKLQFLEAGEKREYELEIGVLNSQSEIESLEEQLRQQTK